MIIAPAAPLSAPSRKLAQVAPVSQPSAFTQLPAFLQRRTGMGIGPTLILIALSGLVGLVWLVFGLALWALVATA